MITKISNIDELSGYNEFIDEPTIDDYTRYFIDEVTINQQL